LIIPIKCPHLNVTITETLTLRVGRDAKLACFIRMTITAILYKAQLLYAYTKTPSTNNFENSGPVLDYLFVMCDSIGYRTGHPLCWQ